MRFRRVLGPHLCLAPLLLGGAFVACGQPYPVITQAPLSQIVVDGSNASFSVTATGQTPLSYFWYFEGASLADGGRISGASTAVLTISNVIGGDAGNYHVVVSNRHDVAVSDPANLTVVSPPSFTNQPTGQTVVAGGSVTFNVAAAGTEPLEYRWKKDGVDLVDAGRVSGSATMSLSITNVQPGDAGDYSVIVTNAYGQALSTSATLAVVFGSVDHFVFSELPASEYGGLPFAITLSAVNSNGAIVGDFSAPVELVLDDAAPAVLEDRFESGIDGWVMDSWFITPQKPIFEASSFDTDGDGVTNGAGRMNFDLERRGILYHHVPLVAGETYDVSAQFALHNPTANPGQYPFSLDAFYFTSWNWGSSSQLARMDFSPAGPGAIERGTMRASYTATGTGDWMIAFRMLFYQPDPGMRVYLDNVRVRRREVGPIVVDLLNGQWTGNVTLFRTGTNQLLVARNDAGVEGRASALNVLEYSGLAVDLPDPGWRPAGVDTEFSVLVSNAGPTTATGVQLTNLLPASLHLLAVEGSSNHTLVPGGVVCNLPTLAPNASSLVTLHVSQAEVGEALVEATVNIPSYDPDPNDNTAARSLQFVPLLRGSGVQVVEQAGGTNATFHFELSAASSNEVAVSCSVEPLTAVEGSDYLPPATQFTFPAGITNQSLQVPILDDSYYEPPQTFALQLVAASNSMVLLESDSYQGVILDNESLPVLEVVLPPEAAETAGTLSNSGAVQISLPLDTDLLVSLASSDPTELTVPDSATIPAGSTNAAFNLSIQDDNLLDGTQSVLVTAMVSNWPSASGSMAIADNEPASISLQVLRPKDMAEGRGTVPNAIRVVSAAPVATNLDIALASSDLSELILPSSVTITANLTSVSFPATIVDDPENDGSQTVTVTASAPGFSNAVSLVIVRDNDVHHFEFSSIPNGLVSGSVTSTVSFSFYLYAVDIEQIPVPFGTQNNPVYVQLGATGELGTVQFSPGTVPFFGNSAASISKAVVSNGYHTGVRLWANDGLGHTGESDPFTVLAPESQQTRISGVHWSENGIQFEINTVAGRYYGVESANQLSGPWEPIDSNLPGPGGWMPWQGTNTQAASQFYRALLQPGPPPEDPP